MVSIVRYIPVDVATFGSKSNITRTGQNIVPGPIPQKAAQKAAKKDNETNMVSPLLLALKSPYTNVYPHSTFSLYCC